MNFSGLKSTLCTILIFSISVLFAGKAFGQKAVQFKGIDINSIDKKKKKQGVWVYFDKAGDPVMSCIYKNDNQVGPIVFYNNGDTAFLRFPQKDSIETFMVFGAKHRYYGNFVHGANGSVRTEVESETDVDKDALKIIADYKYIELNPVYYFGQKKINEFVSAHLTGSGVILNKQIEVYLTINSSGYVKDVQFADSNSFLSPTEQNELEWIFSTMPRWQPCFKANEAVESKVKFTTKSSIIDLTRS
ncbi:MAG: hypothetical protein EOO02_11225 [Chitinophagaceae bacterium]|nr:MAG: hypothetical protein EOO02_11225 [Chitinophagaceae bacterium]